MKKKQLIAFASAMALAVTSLAGCGKSEGSTQKEAVSEAEGTAKEDLPLSKYPETVTGSAWRFSDPMPSFRTEWLMMIIHT